MMFKSKFVSQFPPSLTVAAIGLCALIGCNKAAAPPAFAMPPAAVTVATAVSGEAPAYLDEIGTCTARQYVSITPRVTGAITEILFKDGVEVHAGDPLFTIDTRPYQATLDQAIADQKRNSAAVDLAQSEWDRMKKLLSTNAISQDDYDKMKGAALQADAQFAGSNAAVENARLNLEYCHISSPIDGRAGQRLVDIGNVVMANNGSLLVIQTLDPIYADFTCVESDLPAVQEHAKSGTLSVQVLLPSDTGEGRKGDLTFIDTQVQDQAGRVKLRATVNNPDRHFWPGQFINVRLILSVDKNAVLVPASVTQIGQAGPYVYVVNAQSTAEIRPVKLGQRQGDSVVILEGLKPGENVVNSGTTMVIPGMPVNVINAAASPATTQ